MGLGTPTILEPCSTFNAADLWLGINTSTAGGGLPQRIGCDVHCEDVCIMEDDTTVAVNSWGSRWARPILQWPSRNSKGEMSPLISGMPQLFPAKASFERGACFQNGTPIVGPHGSMLANGVEHFGPNRKVCQCDPWLEKLWGDDHEGCRDGTLEEYLRTGVMADTWFFHGHDYGEDFEMWGHCRRERLPFEHRSLRFQLVTSPEGVYATHIARMGLCQHDLLTICCGSKHYSSRCMHGTHDYHNPHSDRSVWNYFNITSAGLTPWIDLRQEDHPHRSPAFLATLSAQNRALAKADDIGISQLENRDIGGLMTANDNLNIWSQYITPDDDGIPYTYWDGRDTQSGLTGRLRYNGAPVEVQLTILSAYLVMHFSLWKIADRKRGSMAMRPDNEPSLPDVVFRLMAAAQVHLHMELGTKAFMEPVIVQRPWMESGDVQLSVAHSGDLGDRYPTVTSSPSAGVLDEVEFIDPEGHPFTPPREVDWWGSAQELTDLSVPGGGTAKWRNVWSAFEGIGNETPGGDIHNVCCQAARGLGPNHPLAVYGSPTDHGSWSDAIQYYRGSIVMHLPVSETPGVGLCPPAERVVA